MACAAQAIRSEGSTPRTEFEAEVIAGLTAPRKSLPPKYFYDAQGSALFEAITRLPEYYPTRTELAILEGHGPEIGALAPPGAALVEFGSGSSAKLRALLPHLPRPALYLPVDVSAEFLAAETEHLARDLPDLDVVPVAADFARPFALPARAGTMPRLGFFPGSTIGNFDPGAAARLLDHFGAVLGGGALLLVGVDLVKDAAILHAAYNDAAGVTAAFNLNLLARINRELGADFDLDAFVHRAVYDARLSRIEMHLVSRHPQTVRIGGVTLAFAAGESIHTENSYKYTVPGFRALAAGAGWTALAVWTDPHHLFSVHALRRGSR